jgi:hypothetical protein
MIRVAALRQLDLLSFMVDIIVIASRRVLVAVLEMSSGFIAAPSESATNTTATAPIARLLVRAFKRSSFWRSGAHTSRAPYGMK